MTAEAAPVIGTGHDCAEGLQLSQLIEADEIDAALRAGLMAFTPCPACDSVQAATLLATQQRLHNAWAARERYRARNARLALRAAEREAKRKQEVPEKRSALPAAAAVILARAKAKAAERGKA